MLIGCRYCKREFDKPSHRNQHERDAHRKPTMPQPTHQNAALLEALKECADALAYAAYNIDGSKLENLDPRVVESTGVSETALIAERRARALLASPAQAEEAKDEMPTVCHDCDMTPAGVHEDSCPEAAVQAEEAELPPLPVPAYGQFDWQPHFSGDQMRSYALACRADLVKQVAELKKALHEHEQERGQGLTDDSWRTFFIVARPGMAPRIGMPIGEVAASLREWYAHNPEAEIYVVNSWGSSAGCQTVENGREILFFDDALQSAQAVSDKNGGE